jgi:hypothetical protein
LFSLASSHPNDIVPFLIAQSITTGARPVFVSLNLVVLRYAMLKLNASTSISMA